MEAYEEIYQRMKDKYIAERGTAFDEASDIAIRLRVLAGELYNMQTSLAWAQRQLSPATASGRFLDYFAEQRGLTRYAPAKARGKLTFRVNEVLDVPVVIPSGTAVAAEGESPVTVYTTEDSVLPVNTYSVEVNAEAEEAGYRGNIDIGTARYPINVPSEIDSVVNLAGFQGGADEESDTALPERVRNSYISRPNGMNAAYYIALATSVEGITKAGVLPKNRGVGTVDVFVCGTDDNISADKLAEVQQVLEDARGLNVNVLAVQAMSTDYDLNVAVTSRPGFENDEVIAKCTDAFESYITSLPVGGKVYLSQLGKYLMDTGCIEAYEFDVSMTNQQAAGSNFFVTGDVYIEVV